MKSQNKQELVDGIKAFGLRGRRKRNALCEMGPCPQESRPSRSGGKRSSNAILKIDLTTQNKTAPLGAANFTKVIDQ